MVERDVVEAFLEDPDYLDPFQSGCRSGHGIESALVTLMGDLCRGQDGGAQLYSCGIHLEQLQGLGIGGNVL